MPQPQPRIHPYLVLLIGLLAVSTAAIFIRLAQEEDVPSLLIACGRLTVATLVLTPIAWRRYRHQFARLDRRDILIMVAGGVILAAHFALWVTSLEYTSVVASVVLVTTNPLFVALLSFPLLGERVSVPMLGGIVLAFIGGVIVALSGDAGDPPTREAPLLGNALALMGGFAVAVYIMIGRRMRNKLTVIPYIWMVYGIAAIALIPVVLLRGEPIAGHSLIGYGWVLGLGLIPQLIGHSSFNYALGYLPAAFVSLVVLVEPVVSGILAFGIFGEVPSLLSVAGSLVILIGVGVASRPQGKQTVQLKTAVE